MVDGSSPMELITKESLQITSQMMLVHGIIVMETH